MKYLEALKINIMLLFLSLFYSCNNCCAYTVYFKKYYLYKDQKIYFKINEKVIYNKIIKKNSIPNLKENNKYIQRYCLVKAQMMTLEFKVNNNDTIITFDPKLVKGFYLGTYSDNSLIIVIDSIGKGLFINNKPTGFD